MRGRIGLRTAGAALLLALVLCACGRRGEAPAPPSPEPEAAPGIAVRHLDLDAGNENVEFYYEVPRMEGDSPAAERFNAFFDGLYEDFMATEPQKVRELLDAAAPGTPSAEEPFRYCRSAQVRDVSEAWVSVTLSYDWYMGGVLDYGIDGYTFDRETGERLFLDDVLPGTEDTIRAAVARGLREQYPELAELADGQGNTPVTEMERIPFRELDFYVAEGGAVTVVFDKYEIAPGVAGMLTVVVGEDAGETQQM